MLVESFVTVLNCMEITNLNMNLYILNGLKCISFTVAESMASDAPFTSKYYKITDKLLTWKNKQIELYTENCLVLFQQNHMKM